MHIEPMINRPCKRPDGHRDARRFEQTLKKATADGKISPAERKAVRRAFNQMEPGEKKIAMQRHPRLAALLHPQPKTEEA